MKPNNLSRALRVIASRIDRSNRPKLSMVVSDLERVVVAMDEGEEDLPEFDAADIDEEPSDAAEAPSDAGGDDFLGGEGAGASPDVKMNTVSDLLTQGFTQAQIMEAVAKMFCESDTPAE